MVMGGTRAHPVVGQQAQAGEGPSTGQRARGRSGRRPDRFGDPGSRALLTRPACPLQSFLCPLASRPSTPLPPWGRSGQALGLQVAWSVREGRGPSPAAQLLTPVPPVPAAPPKASGPRGRALGPRPPAVDLCPHPLRPLPPCSHES